jgi:hypothetical protein
MATSPDSEPADDLQPEYDFTRLKNVVRGKYAQRYGAKLRVVRIAEDIADEFADEAEVNAALREYIAWKHGPSRAGA